MLAELQAVEREAVLPSTTLIPSLPSGVRREERVRNAYITRARAANVVEDVAERQVVVQDMFRLPAMLDVAGRMSYSDALNLGMGPITREFAQTMPYRKMQTKANVEPIPRVGNMAFSNSGADFLMRREAPWQPWYRITDEYGRITHILPHDIGDGGYTFGFGLYLRHGSPEIQRLQGAMHVSEARERMLQRVQDDVDAINDWLRENNITVTQNQFDALVSHRYNRGNISRLLPFLRSGNFDRESLFEAMIGETNPNFREGLTNRYNEELEIFLNNNYNVGPQFEFNFD